VGGGAHVVAGLRQLLAVAGVAPPYVLVGHSLGGLFSQLYARAYPNQVSGMVLVDPPTPNLRDFLSPSAWAGAFESQLDPGPSVIPGYVNERYRVETIFDEINAAGPLPGIPVTYLAATIKPSLDQLPPADQARALEIVTQLPVAAAFYIHTIPGARFVPVPDTTHYIQTERPDVVIAAAQAAAANRILTITPQRTDRPHDSLSTRSRGKPDSGPVFEGALHFRGGERDALLRPRQPRGIRDRMRRPNSHPSGSAAVGTDPLDALHDQRRIFNHAVEQVLNHVAVNPHPRPSVDPGLAEVDDRENQRVCSV
jgi:hypothetical protein